MTKKNQKHKKQNKKKTKKKTQRKTKPQRMAQAFFTSLRNVSFVSRLKLYN